MKRLILVVLVLCSGPAYAQRVLSPTEAKNSSCGELAELIDVAFTDVFPNFHKMNEEGGDTIGPIGWRILANNLGDGGTGTLAEQFYNIGIIFTEYRIRCDSGFGIAKRR